MSDTDSFIDEVTEEVRRDRLFALMRRYGWIAVLVVLLIVGGTAWNEWRKAQARETAQSFGDALMAGLGSGASDASAAALSSVEAPNPGAAAIRDLLAAAESMEATPQEAASRLLVLADSDGVEPVYRQIAILKAVAMPGSGLSAEERRSRLEGLALSEGLARLLAEEQLALIDVETGDTQGALKRLQAVAADAQATPGLRRRASQVIVALGGELPGSGQAE
ncbi:MAG: tetratricopeptide repeat protein [Pseudomonadota bacterium]|uniref:tetratricopeptide repeat protein n=1 Tax=Roseovarius TaxID=74030 RepID=UPI0022A79B1A|nr:tetratricopeptide repeat protein [Roseovarius sp. EGI FJ00037]MCZ0810646.1 tetratricopeptide repeat protein [Roseovarius sp. EGI FJ00037]